MDITSRSLRELMYNIKLYKTGKISSLKFKDYFSRFCKKYDIKSNVVNQVFHYLKKNGKI